MIALSITSLHRFCFLYAHSTELPILHKLMTDRGISLDRGLVSLEGREVFENTLVQQMRH